MADIKQDLFGLQYSQNFTIQGMQEADIDLNLTPASSASATVYGRVTDGTAPISDATVKLFDDKGLPFKHTLTDANGEYSMDGVPAGTYSLGTVKNGYRLSNTIGVTLSESDTTEINFICTPDATLSLGAIAGTLTIDEHEGQNEPLSGAKVSLLDINGEVVATTYTASDGEFAFYDVPDGSYTALSSADGYLPASPMTVTITGGSIANLTMSMNVDARTYNGTVSGIIRDNNGRAVAGCFVGLYRLVPGEDGTTKEVLVATTKSNASGKYMFGSVNGGQYLVKAKMNK